MSVIWHKVWFDLWRNKARTILAILSIAAGVFAIGAIFGMVDQLITGMDSAHQETIPSHIQIFLKDRIDKETAIRLEKIDGVEEVEVANEVTVRRRISKMCYRQKIFVAQEDRQQRRNRWPRSLPD